MRPIARLRVLGLGLTLAACRAAPEELDPAVVLPADWTSVTVADEPAPATWWRDFSDPRLARLVDEALVHNRDLGAAVARLEAALASARAVQGALAPQVDAGADAARRRQNFIGLPIPGGDVLSSTVTSYGVSLDVSWEVDLWGRLRASASAADAEARAAGADLRGAALSIAAQTAKGWFALIEARQQMRLAAATVRSFDESAEWIRARYQRGLTTALDLRLALSNAADARAARAATEDAAQRAARALEILLGRYPAEDIETSDDLPPLPPPPPAGLPAALLERRPDLVAARERVAAQDERVAASRAALLPGLRLTASGGRTSAELEDLLDGGFDVWSLGASLTAPLFQGGRLRAEVDAAEARRAEAWNAWAADLLRACGEVESALAAEERLARRVAELEQATLQARAAEALALERYRSGVEALVTLLDAQRRSVTNESRWLAARRNLLDNRVDLLLALGGGFDVPRPDAALAQGQEQQP